MAVASAPDPRLGRRLILDELFDLSLYRSLRDVSDGRLRATLDALIPTERRHVAFWQSFFGLSITRLDLGRRLKLVLLIAVCRVFGASAIHLVLEAIEVHGVRKYLQVWSRYGDTPLGGALREVLEDEFKHEDATVAGDTERTINPERVRNIFLGLNDGLVEILGAVSGFFAAFGTALTVLVAALTVAVAGALSMARARTWPRARRPRSARRRAPGADSSARGTGTPDPENRPSARPRSWARATWRVRSCPCCRCCSARTPRCRRSWRA